MGQVGLCGADEEDGAEDVGGVGGVEVLRGDGFDGAGGHDGGAVDDDVDLEGFAGRLGIIVIGGSGGGKVVLAGGDDGGDAGGRANVGAAWDGEDAV